MPFVPLPSVTDWAVVPPPGTERKALIVAFWVAVTALLKIAEAVLLRPRLPPLKVKAAPPRVLLVPLLRATRVPPPMEKEVAAVAPEAAPVPARVQVPASCLVTLPEPASGVV